MRHRKDLAYLLAKGYIKIAKDSIGIEEDQIDKEELQKVKKENSDLPSEDSTRIDTSKAILTKPKKVKKKTATRGN
jgi:transketolase N-terminal domain/subunit